MSDFESLAHVRWECKYHVIFIPKYRRKVIYGNLRSSIGGILRDLCKQKGIELLEGHAMNDHVHLCLSVPPKYSISYTVGFLKGKSAVRIHRELMHERRMTVAVGLVAATIPTRRASVAILAGLLAVLAIGVIIVALS